MTKQDLFCYLLEGGLQKKIHSARLSFENVEGYDHEVEFHVPPFLMKVLSLLEETPDGRVRLLGKNVFPVEGLADIKMVKVEKKTF